MLVQWNSATKDLPCQLVATHMYPVSSTLKTRMIGSRFPIWSGKYRPTHHIVFYSFPLFSCATDVAGRHADPFGDVDRTFRLLPREKELQHHGILSRPHSAGISSIIFIYCLCVFSPNHYPTFNMCLFRLEIKAKYSSPILNERKE